MQSSDSVPQSVPGSAERVNTLLGEMYDKITEKLKERGELDDANEELAVVVVSQAGEEIDVIKSSAEGGALILEGRGTKNEYRCLLTMPQLVQFTFRKQPRRKQSSLGFTAG